VTANDVGPKGHKLSVTAVIASADIHGTVRLAGDRISYCPEMGFTGTASFGYVVSDGHGGSSIGTVQVTVVPRGREGNIEQKDIPSKGIPSG